MLRGAIDYITETEIGGWIYCEVGPVKRRLVLAYHEGKCLGSGPIENFRQDLLDAGLGDGVLGFRFPISKTSPDQLPRVSVKLDGSDLVLVQSGNSAPHTKSASRVIHSRADIEWMRSRRWLTQAEFDLLKYLSQSGVYEKLLPGPAPAQSYINVREEAKNGLELMCMSDIQLLEDTLPESADLDAFASGLPKEDCPVVALWSPEKRDVTVVEGSHREKTAQSLQRAGVVHSIRPDQVVFIDLRAKCTLRSSSSEDSYVSVFRAALPDPG